MTKRQSGLDNVRGCIFFQDTTCVKRDANHATQYFQDLEPFLTLEYSHKYILSDGTNKHNCCRFSMNKTFVLDSNSCAHPHNEMVRKHYLHSILVFQKNKLVTSTCH